MKIILLITQGRSAGSTLIRILNTIEGCNICGENIGAFKHLMDFYSKVKRTYSHPASVRTIKEAKVKKLQEIKIKSKEEQQELQTVLSGIQGS